MKYEASKIEFFKRAKVLLSMLSADFEKLAIDDISFEHVAKIYMCLSGASEALNKNFMEKKVWHI